MLSVTMTAICMKSARRAVFLAAAFTILSLPILRQNLPRKSRRISKNAPNKNMNTTTDPTPTERQAAIIADLEARLTLADERLFYVMAENARLRAQVEGTR